MCGILVKTNCLQVHDFAKALELMKHRGPNSSAISNPEPGIFLGHNRLSILDLSMKASQPMKERGVEVVFNGEIYNFQKLKSKYNLQTNSTGDTEVILKLYLKIGTAMFEELDGEFAIVVYDNRYRSTKIIAARDPLGIKPLYYYHDMHQLIISSEIKPMFEFVPKRLNEEAEQQLRRFGYVKDGTMFAGINKIEPGFYAEFNLTKKEYSFKRYFTIVPDPFASEFSLKDAISQAVKKRMISDVPISATLSGGIDSTIIVGIMSKISDKVKTYTIGFSEDDEDLQIARKVSEYFGTEHHEQIITDPFPAIEQLLYYMEEPMDKGSLIPTWYLANTVEEKVTLIGEGADECFGGYNRHIGFFNQPEKTFEDYFEKYLAISPGKAEINPKYDPENGNSILQYDLETEIPNYHNPRIDKMFMAHSIEARVPYLDPRVVNIAMGIPYNQKQNPEKKILREIFKDLIPPCVYERKKKALKIPYMDWIKRPEVKQVLEGLGFGPDPENLPRNYGRKLWNEYLLAKWKEINFNN